MAASLVIQDSINVCSPVADFTISFILFNETHGAMDFYLLYCDVYRLCKEHHGVVVNKPSSYSRVPGSDSCPEGLIRHSQSQFTIQNNFTIGHYPNSDTESISERKQNYYENSLRAILIQKY
jgi:hypothetical protein